jgi:hypothetical protein
VRHERLVGEFMVNHPVSDVGEVEKREALERVLASNPFHRTDQLKSLLRYVCEREISGTGDSLDECTVAKEALGRRSDYSPFEDGTVRNRIHNLRRRLEHYYEVENTEDPIRIVVPKGSYCPVFERKSAAPPAVAPVRAIVAPRKPDFWNRPVPLRIVCSTCILTMAVAVGIFAAWRSQQRGIDPVIAEAWGPLVAKNANPLLCIATSAQLTLIQRPMDPPDGPAVSSPDLLTWYRSLKSLPHADNIYLGPSLTSPFWGDVAGAVAVIEMMSGAGIAPELLPESAVQLPALNRRNLVMFGRPGFSNTVSSYLADKPFQVRIPDERHITAIRNMHPKPGEPAEYDASAESRSTKRETAFGLITVMPGRGSVNLRTVIFSGTLSPGTQAASEFFSSAKQLESLRRLFHKEGLSGFPASYQVVVRSHVFGTSALDVEYVTHRVVSAQ